MRFMYNYYGQVGTNTANNAQKMLANHARDAATVQSLVLSNFPYQAPHDSINIDMSGYGELP